MIMTRTPLRIGLAGGGTDIPPYAHTNGGVCVNIAINKYVYVMVNGRFDDTYRIGYTTTEIRENVEDISHDLIREALLCFPPGFVEVVTVADVPGHGTGLGSSGAVTVGTITALDAYISKGTVFYRKNYADLASKIEMEALGKDSGYQDNYAAAMGGLNCMYFSESGAAIEPLPYGQEIADRLMLFYTGKTRPAQSVLPAHKNAPIEYLENQKALAVQMKHKIAKGHIQDIGILLDEGWELKRTINGVTSPEIDAMYLKAKKAGATGGKVCGAGGGGFLCMFVPIAKQTAVRRALKGYRELIVGLDSDGVKVVYDG